MEANTKEVPGRLADKTFCIRDVQIRPSTSNPRKRNPTTTFSSGDPENRFLLSLPKQVAKKENCKRPTAK
jgi:hypothetical protein